MIGKKKPKVVHLRGTKSMAQCGVKASKKETTANLREVTCEACADSTRFQRLIK